MIEFIQANPGFIKWTVVFSLLMFFGTLAIVPWLVTLIPADYFSHGRRDGTETSSRQPLFRLSVLLLKNAVGYLLIPLGIIMLVLPGQGVLTILTGLMLIDFPGKFRLERRLVCLPKVTRLMNWLRLRAGKPPLQL